MLPSDCSCVWLRITAYYKEVWWLSCYLSSLRHYYLAVMVSYIWTLGNSLAEISNPPQKALLFPQLIFSSKFMMSPRLSIFGS